MAKHIPFEEGTSGTAELLEDWMTRDELARAIDVSVETLSRWETRRIGPPCVRVGRRVYYSRSGFDAWMREQEGRVAGRTKRGR